MNKTSNHHGDARTDVESLSRDSNSNRFEPVVGAKGKGKRRLGASFFDIGRVGIELGFSSSTADISGRRRVTVQNQSSHANADASPQISHAPRSL